MKKYLQNAGIALLTISVMISSCKKSDPDTGTPPPTIPTTPTTPPADATLKSASSAYFPVMGMALTYNYAQMADVMAILKREVNTITFGNELKEESIVRGGSGVYDYTTADAFYNLAAANGLQVTGHTLVWYAQQNASYLNSLINPVTVTPSTTNLVTNGTFEADPDAATTDIFTGWQDLNHSNGTFSAATGTAAYAGSRALQATVTTAGQSYNTQMLMRTPIPVTKGNTYSISFWVKGSAAATTQYEIRSSDATVVSYQSAPVTTAWTKVTYSYTATGTTMQLAFDLGANVGTFYVDDVSVFATTTSSTTTLTAAQKSVIIDSAMKKYIVNTIKHFSGKIKTWDVVNEPFTDNGRLRTPQSYTIPAANANNQFLYAQYIGSNAYDQNNYVLKAFQYAKAADPTVTTFINDYNLEYSKAKVDSMKALVTFINKSGALVDGVGTQMHITLATSLSSIDYAFATLASTGLKVRISELDIALNPTKTASFVADAAALTNQANMYKYVVQSYIKNVPAAQRYGITIWGVTDTDSWLNSANAPDYPLLFDKTYTKKPAYTGFIQGLQ
jgi:endo-1,4-beta-xylanase